MILNYVVKNLQVSISSKFSQIWKVCDIILVEIINISSPSSMKFYQFENSSDVETITPPL